MNLNQRFHGDEKGDIFIDSASYRRRQLSAAVKYAGRGGPLSENDLSLNAAAMGINALSSCFPKVLKLNCRYNPVILAVPGEKEK